MTTCKKTRGGPIVTPDQITPKSEELIKQGMCDQCGYEIGHPKSWFCRGPHFKLKFVRIKRS